MAFDYARGNKDLKKKNVEKFCNMLLQYAHDGISLELFLRENFITKSAWDKYVKKHPALRAALMDAKERARGFMYEQLYSKAQTTALINPQLFKILIAGAGYTDKSGDEATDIPPPSFTFVEGSPPKRGPNAINPDPSKLIVQETGELIPKGGNGSNGGNGSR